MGHRPAIHEPKICAVCGKEFVPLTNRQKCCHGACGREWHHRLEIAYQEKHKTGYKPKACLMCGEIFVPTGRCAKYCSKCREGAYFQDELSWGIRHSDRKAEIFRKHQAKRRVLGYVPLNRPFDGCEGHHIDKEQVIYIPKELHQSVRHNMWTGVNMDVINAHAIAYLQGVTSGN